MSPKYSSLYVGVWLVHWTFIDEWKAAERLIDSCDQHRMEQTCV